MTITRAAIQTPTPGATTTTFQVMTYNPLTDGHTLVLDLNDHSAFTMHNKGLKMPMPPKEDSRSFNLRVPGERVVREQYKNRHITYTCWLRDATPNDAGSTTALLTDVRNLLFAVNNPPYELRIALPKATQYTYADVVKVTHDIPSDPQQILAQAITHVTIDFECLPGLRGDRVVLQNLVMNPGFEAPSGPAVTAFSDSFANFNAYTVRAGGALAADLTRYADVILADAPIRYYRMDEASGGVVFDASGAPSNGAYNGSPTLSVSGALAGDTDTAVTLNGTTQYVGLNSNFNLPTSANAPASLEIWTKMSGNPGSTAIVAELGDNTAGGRFFITISTSGVPQAQASAATTAGAALSLNTWHHLVATYDGTNLRMYVDGALYAGPTAATWTPSYTSSHYGSFGASSNAGSFFAGSVDEGAIYATALSATQVTNHYNAGHVAPASNLANSMVIPSGGRVSFGSPVWSAYNLWQSRFRYNSGATGTWYLHYTDANNYLAAVVTQTTLTLNQTVAGTTHQLGQTTGLHLVPGTWYWLQVTQFPTVSTDAAQAQAQLYGDNNGAVGTGLGSLLGPFATFDSVTALEGAPQIAASGATLPLGGVTAGHTVGLFGPGGWTFNGLNGAATGTAALSWDGARSEMGMSGDGGSRTYPSGPVTSFGAARLDLAPAGTVDAQVRLYTGGAAFGTSAIPVNAAADVLGISAYVKTSAGYGNTATLTLLVTEYDASGTQLRQNTAATLTGPQTSWTLLSANYTTGTSCASVDVALRALDGTTNSQGQQVWWDNVTVYDQTTTGQTTMPYCEVRFPQSPAQLMVSGIAGDIEAPAFVALGLPISTWSPGTTVTYAMGRRALASAGATLVGPGIGLAGDSSPVLDIGSYGGFYITKTVTSAGWNPRSFSSAPANFLGTYHLMQRMYTGQSSGNLANVQIRVLADQVGSGWFGKSDGSDFYSAFYGSFYQATTNSATWTNADAGPVIVPPFTQGNLTDQTAIPLVPRGQLEDTTGGGSTMRVNWQMLLPVDSSLLIGQINNPSNAGTTYTNEYVWAYFDGLGLQQGQPAAAAYSFGTTALVNPAQGVGGPGTTSSGYLNVNSAAETYTTLDPQAVGLPGVNQFGVYIATSGSMPQLLTELAYTPLYLYPR